MSPSMVEGEAMVVRINPALKIYIHLLDRSAGKTGYKINFSNDFASSPVPVNRFPPHYFAFFFK